LDYPPRIDRYEVLGKFAQGGMARVLVVRRADSNGFERLFALKTVLPHLAAEEAYVRMFLDEARIASRVNHKNAVQVFDVGEHEGVPYLVMELLKGQHLGRVMRKAAAADASLLRQPNYCALILAQAAEGLHAAHEVSDSDGTLLEVVHRDVSPQNLHVGYDGAVKVLDFGIARALGKLSTTRTGELKGKFAYMAPEQISRGLTIDRRVDLWALGVVAWELLAGRRLFTGDEAQVIWSVMNEPIPHLSTLRPDVPRAFAEVIHACLERARELRPASADELARTLWAHSSSPEAALARTLGEGVSALCRDERMVQEERLASLMRSQPAPVEEPSMPSIERATQRATPIALEPSLPPRRKTGLALAAGAAALCVGAGTWWWMTGVAGTTEPASRPVIEPIAVVPPPTSHNVVAETPEPVPAVVDDLDAEGTIERGAIEASDPVEAARPRPGAHHREPRAEASPSPRPARAVPAPTPVEPTPTASPILGNPY
jgi:serine/threonine-protein kinase